MSDSKELVRRLRRVAFDLKTASRWNGTGLAVDATKDDFLYELYVYFSAALAASPHFKIHVSGKMSLGAHGKRAAKWPKKPGVKANYSYLSLLDAAIGAEAFQLCPGIKINDKDGKARAPDVSLLRAGTSDLPVYSDVFSIWDAKFTSKKNRRLPDTEVSDFIFTYQQLGNPRTAFAWLQVARSPEWHSSGVLTNGLPSTEPDATLASYGVLETSGFPDGPKATRPVPQTSKKAA